MPLDDDQRRRFAVKTHANGCQTLFGLTSIVVTLTILCWHREFVANNFNSGDQHNPVRTISSQVVVGAILRFARENSTWGGERIHGALKNRRDDFTESTMATVLKAYGIEPVPDRQHPPAGSVFFKDGRQLIMPCVNTFSFMMPNGTTSA